VVSVLVPYNGFTVWVYDDVKVINAVCVQFCQPAGWRLMSQKLQPTFFVSALTDIDALRHYCACLTFSEDVAEDESLRLDDGDDTEQELTLVRCSKMYSAKSLVLVSRFDHFETFRVRCFFLFYRNGDLELLKAHSGHPQLLPAQVFWQTFSEPGLICNNARRVVWGTAYLALHRLWPMINFWAHCRVLPSGEYFRGINMLHFYPFDLDFWPVMPKI